MVEIILRPRQGGLNSIYKAIYGGVVELFIPTGKMRFKRYFLER